MLADDTFNRPGKRLFIAIIYNKLTYENKKTMGKTQPYLLEMKFIWVVAGRCNTVTIIIAEQVERF